MNKILYIRENIKGGTTRYCQALYDMFRDNPDCQALPPKDYPTRKSLFFHYYYKSLPLRNAIYKADIIHINGYTALGTIQAILIAHRMGKGIVYSAHWHPFRFLHFPLYSKVVFYAIFCPLICRYVDTVVTINHEDTAFFRRLCSNVVQIPHWLNFEHKQRAGERKANMILFVGRLNDPVKGIQHLIHLKEGVYDIHCVGPGTLPNRSDFHQHVNISDEDLASLYEQASIVVIPSKYEAFSYVALEALSYGTPVLMSDRVRIADYLHNCSGYNIFHYGNYEEFAQKIKETMEITVDTVRVQEIFSTEQIKKQYLDVYRSCIKRIKI